jgi:hypothetical protein
LTCLQNGEALVNVAMGLRNYVRTDDLTDLSASGGAGIDCGAHGCNITAHDCRHQSGIDLFPTHKPNVRGLDHRIGSFNHRY